MALYLTTRLLSRCYNYHGHVFVQQCNHLRTFSTRPIGIYCCSRSTSTDAPVQTLDSSNFDLGKQKDVSVEDARTALVEKRALSTPTHPPLYMDTYKIVQDLSKAGYSQSQAEALVELLTRSLQSSVSTLVTEHVKRHELDLLELRLKGELDTVKGSVVLIERAVLDSLRKDNESLREQIGKMMNGFKEEVNKVQSGLRLDLNLEKSRIKEESTGLQQLIKDTNNTIEKEVAQLKTQIESQKVESIKYLAGGIFSIVTVMLSVVLGLWRLLGK